MSTTKWVIDPAHSEVSFKIKHLVITTVTGNFKSFSGSLTSGPDFENANIGFEADVNSISTNNEQRDTHLKSADFFDAENFPKLVFSSAEFIKKGENEFSLTGDLTIREVTKPISFSVEFGGAATDPWGVERIGFELSGKINRKDFGLTWNAITEAGGALVSEDVKLVANIQLQKDLPA